MARDNDDNGHGWRASRYGLAAFFLVSLPIAWLALRLVLFFQFKPDAPVSAAEIARVFFDGFHRDVFVALLFSAPLLFWFWLVPGRWFGRLWHRALLGFGFFLFWLVEVFLLAAEYYFFEEFRSRFNTVAVDYLLYPTEVFINIWDSYPVGLVVAACATLSAVWLAVAYRLFRRAFARPCLARTRFAFFAGVLVVCLALAPTISLCAAKAGAERTLNEIANNGALSFFTAFWTRHLDYAAFYRTMPRDEAYQRVRRLLVAPKAEFTGGDAQPTKRRIAGDPNRPRLNVVIVLEESLGSEFWGSLGRKEATLTPEMDGLARKEGLLFTNLYASGNRTVRGFEGVLSSFPPLPGDSIVKREQSENVETIARILKRDGYNTIFLYGGRGIFDGMRAFTLANGYDQFVEQKHFEHPTFATIWGVCDEDLFARSIAEFRELAKTGKPFLGTVLSVSNHKPYTYPKGRIPEDPDERTRENAVKYSDWCLGQFFKAARQEAFWTNTVFAVVADHGARVYGSQSIPIFSYEIPLLIAGPAVVKSPARIPHLGCSLDVPPTILGLIGRPYDTLFFGRDLLNDPPEQGRVLINHNRDIGLYAQERLVVLGLKKNVEFYQGDPKVVDLKPLAAPTRRERELEQDCIALYQVADDLYMNRRYRLDPPRTDPAAPPDARRTSP
jgi:phosphoglycerol transferase MdoB-like AlkP superfamily enzyme